LSSGYLAKMRRKTKRTNPDDDMAIVKATYTKSRPGAKAAIRYIEHRPGREGEKVKRELYGSDGSMKRGEAYQMIDDAERGTVFFRIVISPDPEREDTYKDLSLQEITVQTMLQLEERLTKDVPYVAVEHADHAPHRHVHVLACVKGRLNTQDFQALRETATEAAHSQRQERDATRQRQQQQQQEGGQWAVPAAS
jgi:hypothetical protein